MLDTSLKCFFPYHLAVESPVFTWTHGDLKKIHFQVSLAPRHGHMMAADGGTCDFQELSCYCLPAVRTIDVMTGVQQPS